MLDTEDIKKLTEYQLEVFKDVFMTKEDGKKLDVKFDHMQNTLDAVIKDTATKDQEITVLNHRVKATENWIDQASPKLGIEFKH